MALRLREKFEKIATIFAREIHSYIFSPGFYAISLAYLVIPTYLYFRQAFLSSSADLRPLFDILPWALLLFVPAISMRHFTEERKSGTFELLLSSPVSEEMLVFGKFITLLVLMILINAFFLLIPAIASPFASFDYGKIISQYLGSIFLASFLASLTLFVATLTLSQYVAFLLSSVFILLFYLISSSFVTLAFPSTIRSVLEFLSPITQYENFSKGVIEASSLLYFVLFSWFFLYLAGLKLKAPYSVKPDLRKQYILLWVLAFAVLFVGLTLSSRLFARLDLTREKVYTLSPATKKVLSGLDSKLVIKVYASSELPPEVEVVFRDVKALLAEYKKQGKGKIEVYYLKPDQNPKAKIEASNYGIPPIQFNVISNEEYRVKEGYLGLAVLYGGKSDTIPFISDIGSFELKLTSIIYGVSNKNRKKIGIISDSGAKNQFSGISIFAGLLEKQYEIEEVFASRKEYRLDKYDALILIGPLSALETTAISKINDYLNKGGNLFIAADTVKVDPQSMSGENINLNLNEITGRFGLTFNTNIVMDLKNHENVVVTGENNYVIPYPFWVRPTIENNYLSKQVASMYRRIVFLWPESIEVHSKKGLNHYPVLKTSRYAAAQANYYLLDPVQNFESYLGRTKSYVLAAGVQFNASGRKGKVFAVGDADFIDDLVVRQNQENLGFALAAVHWLANNDVLLGLRQKNVRPEAFSFPSKTVKEGVRYLTIAFMALLLGVFGGVYRYLHIRSLRERYVS